MRKIITFLGTTTRETVYQYQGKNYTGRVFGEAMRQFLEFDEMLVFVTANARRQAYPVLEELGDERIRAVDIPLAETSAELWDLFDRLTAQVADGDTVIFDITHALRSIPFLVFLAAAYLRSAKQVTIEKVLYGALELGRDRPAAPVIELTELVTLLDWLMATNQFIYTGDARYLAHLLEKEGRQRRTKALKRAGAELRALSLAMMLCRPLEVMERAGGLETALSSAQQDLAQWARPFALLAHRIEDEYAARALSDPHRRPAEGLSRMLDLIKWYQNNNQTIQAVTLAREWLVTLVGYRLGRGLVLDRGGREHEIAWGINQLSRLMCGRGVDGELNETARALKELPEADRLRRVWDRLSNLRNDLDHAGFRENWAEASKLVKRTDKLLADLEALFEQAMNGAMEELS